MSSILQLMLRVSKKGAGAKKAAAELRRLTKEMEGTTQSIVPLNKELKLAKLALLGLAAGAGALVLSSTKLAARVQTLGVVTAQLGKSVGKSEKEIRSLEQSIIDQGITMRSSREMIAMMIQGNIDLADATDLARMAQDTAVIANLNSSEAAKQLIYVLQTGNIRMARTLGLQVSFAKGYKDMAKSLGVTTDALTQEQIMQARVNAVMEAGARISGTYEAAMGTAGKQLLSLDRYVEEFKVSLGNLFIPILGKAVDALTKFFKTMRFGLDVWSLLLNKHKLVATAFAEHERQVFDTAETYAEYAEEMERAEEATGRFGGDLEWLTEEEYDLELQTLKTSAGYQLMREQLEKTTPVITGTATQIDDVTQALKDMGAESLSAVKQMITSFENAWTDLQAGGPEARAAIDAVQTAFLEGAISEEQATTMTAKIWTAYEGEVAKIEGRQINLWQWQREIEKSLNMPLGQGYKLVRDIMSYDGRTLTIKVNVIRSVTDELRRMEAGLGVQLGGQYGLDVIIPPGFPGDSFPIGVSSGEHVKVTPAQHTTTHEDNRSMFQGANVNINDPLARETVFSYIDEWMGG